MQQEELEYLIRREQVIRQRVERIVKWLCVLLSVLLAGFLAYYIYQYQQKINATLAFEQAREEELLQYRVELNETKQALEKLKRQTSYASTDAEFMVGFMVSDSSDLTYIKEKSDKYGFTPVLVFDCVLDAEAALAAVAEADPSWEVMFYASIISPESFAGELSSAKEALSALGREDVGIFLLRKDYETEQTLSILTDHQMVGYTSYHTSPLSGQNADGTVYFDYSYIRTADVDIGKRVLGCYQAKASMLVVFDMSGIRAGIVSESLVSRTLSVMEGYTKKADCSFSTVEAVKTELSGTLQAEAEYAENIVSETKRLEKRIIELEDMIRKIYSE